MGQNKLEFQDIYDNFQPKILRYMKYMVGELEAEDLTQEIFVKVYQALESFRGDSKLSTWLYRIATNAALDKLRVSSSPLAAHNRISASSLMDIEAHLDNRNALTGEKIPQLEQQVIRKEMNECIMDFVKKLPEGYRAVLVLGEFEGLRNHEISEVLGVSLDTVKIRLHRARLMLKKELEENCPAYWIEENEFIPEIKRRKK